MTEIKIQTPGLRNCATSDRVQFVSQSAWVWIKERRSKKKIVKVHNVLLIPLHI